MENNVCNLCTTQKYVIAQGELWTMVLNNSQSLLGRCYFALNHHSTDITELTDDETLALHEWFRRSKMALDSLFAPDHYNYVMLMNVEPHVHAHIIPRYKGERLLGKLTFNDLDFGAHYDIEWERVLMDDEYTKLADLIKLALPDAGSRS